MYAWEDYFKTMEGIVKKCYETQGDKLLAAADILTECTKSDGIIHLFGAGHSGLVTEDVFWRAATLANVHAIFEPSVAGINEITKSGYMEKIEGMGQIIIDYNRFAKNDVLIAISNSGNNAVTIDVAKAAQDLGVKVIVFTNVIYSDFLKPHHSSTKKLKDFADLVIDNCSFIGDAAVKLDGLDMKVGATSTIPVIYMLNSVLVQVCDNLLKEGIIPDVYYNGHMTYELPDAKTHNDELVEKYYRRIRNL